MDLNITLNRINTTISDPEIIKTTLPYMEDLKRTKFRTILPLSLLSKKLLIEVLDEKSPVLTGRLEIY